MKRLTEKNDPHYDISDGWVCGNDRSNYCCGWTDDNFGCEKWETED